jgi:hypothetical protein
MNANKSNQLNQIVVEGEKYYFNLGFDIGEYDDGLWWLQIYNSNRNLLYDKPFASSIFNYLERRVKRNIRKIIKYKVLYPKGFIQ